MPFYLTGKRIFNLLGVICVIGILRFPLIICGWCSIRKFSVLGRLRSVAQIISYEVSLIFILFSLIFLLNRFSLIIFIDIQIFV